MQSATQRAPPTTSGIGGTAPRRQLSIFLGKFDRIIDLDAEVSNNILVLRMPEWAYEP